MNLPNSDVAQQLSHDEVVRIEDRFQIPTYRKKALAAVRGEGAWLWDANGRRYLDLYGGHCVAILGHNHPGVTAALKRQLDDLLFYSNAVYSPVRARAAQRLAELAPVGLQHVFFCNSGTEANETALKLARKTTGRPRVVAMESGFHGRTLGSLAATWGSYRAPYADVMGPTDFVPFGDAETLASMLERTGDVAAVIIEPMQSMAGVTEAPASYFQAIRKLTETHGACLIFDEIQTGVGRTGTFSISERYGMTPDLITLAKSLGNGVPVGAVLVSDEISAGIGYGDQGTTFGGGMLAMAAVEATLTALVDENIMDRVRKFESAVRHRLGPVVRDIRGAGCLLGIDIGMAAAPVAGLLLDEGYIVGTAGDPHVIRLMPPAVTPLEVMDDFAQALESCMARAPRPE